MVGREDGETGGHTAHWEKRRVGGREQGGWGFRSKERDEKSREGIEEDKGGEKEGGRRSEGERIREKEIEEERGREQD